MKSTAIIVAAGKGSRMGSETAKQYMMLKNKPVLYYSLKAFEKSDIDEIVLVVGEGEQAYANDAIIKHYGITKVRNVVTGGRERCDSVYNGLKAAEGSEYVLIHDGARPLVSCKMINRIIKEVVLKKACIVGVRAKDTIKITDCEGKVLSTPNRNDTWQIQTPQAFKYALLMDAYIKQNTGNNTEGNVKAVTDDAVMVERYTGESIYVIEGDYKNIKITTPEDLLIAENILCSNRLEQI